MPSPNDPSSPSEVFGHAENASLHNCALSNISGHAISPTANGINLFFDFGNFQSLAPLLSDDQKQHPPLGQNAILHGHPAPGKSKNPFTQGSLYDPLSTNSSNEPYSPPSSFLGDRPLQYQVSEENDEFPNSVLSSTNSSLVSLISDSESEFSSSETTSRYSSDAEVYVNAMLPLRHGYPLPNPRPNSSLPIEKRKVGTMWGDVGIFSEDGSFDYLFNPLLSRTDPRNPPDLPITFDDVPLPVAVPDEIPSAFNSKTGICSRGIHCNMERETMELSISQCSNTGGALLFLPDGASQEGLKNTGSIKEFIIKHAELWMSYAISTGRDIDRDSLYFVTGCTKAGDWGIATFNPSTSSEKSSLKLGQSKHPKDPRYIWEKTPSNGTARTGPGPDRELDDGVDVPQNQTLFIKGYKIAFSQNAWNRISPQGTLAINTGQSMNDSTSDVNTSNSQTSGGGEAPSSGSAIYNTFNCNSMNLESFPENDVLFHPLDTINRILLEEIPEAEIAIAHDDEWCEMTDGYNSIDSELIVQLLRSKYGASYCEGAAVLSTTQNAMSVGEEIIDLEMTTSKGLSTTTGVQRRYSPTPTIMTPKLQTQVNPGDNLPWASTIPNMFAKIIGIDFYHQSEGFPHLPGAVRDGLVNKACLASHINVPESQIRMLTNQRTSRGAILKALRSLSEDSRIEAGDPIVIFYAGHGTEVARPVGWDSSDKSQMLVPQDYCFVKGSEILVIPDRTIEVLLEDIAEKMGNNITVVFDSFYSASAAGAPKSELAGHRSVIRLVGHTIDKNFDGKGAKLWHTVPKDSGLAIPRTINSAGMEGNSQSSKPNAGSSINENLQLTGRALITRAAPIVDSDPAKVTLGLVIEINNAVKDNKDAVARQIAPTGGRLEVVEEVLRGWNPDNKEENPWMNHFKVTLEEELRKLGLEVSDESNFRKFLDHEYVQKRIEDTFVRINEARVLFELALGVRVFKAVYEVDKAVEDLFLNRPKLSYIVNHDYLPEDDVRQFFRSHVKSLGWKQLFRLQDVPDIDRLVAQSAGSFIFPSTVMKYLGYASAENECLSTLFVPGSTNPQNPEETLLDSLYRRIFLNPLRRFKSRYCLDILHTILCSADRISTSLVAELLLPPQKTNPALSYTAIVDGVLDSLHAVLYTENNKVLSYHKSFPDFLFDRARSGEFWCDKATHDQPLTDSWFRVMVGLQFNVANIPSSFIFDRDNYALAGEVERNISAVLSYACRNWGHHCLSATKSTTSDPLHETLLEFLQRRALFWIEVMNLLDSHGGCHPMLQTSHEWVIESKGNSPLAENLTEAGSFALYFSGGAWSSTPHLYVSAVATWPRKSDPIQAWKSHFPGIPQFANASMGGTLLMTLNVDRGVNAFSISSDSSRIASGCFDKSVPVWNALTGEEKHVLNGHTESVNSVAFSSDSSRIVSGSFDSSVRVWDTLTGEEEHVLNGHTYSVNSVAFSSDGSRIVSGFDHRLLGVWDESMRSRASRYIREEIAKSTPGLEHTGWFLSPRGKRYLMFVPPGETGLPDDANILTIPHSFIAHVDLTNSRLGSE